MNNKKFITLVAILLYKTEVVRSLGRLGAGEYTLDQIRKEIGAFGCLTAKEYEQLIISYIKCDEK